MFFSGVAAFFILLSSLIYSAQEAENHKQVCYGMTILLDSSENHFEAVASVTLAALLEEASPLLISAYILAHIQNYQDLADQDPHDLFKEYHNFLQIPFSRRTDDEKERFKNIILSIQTFTPKMFHKWVVKLVSPEMYLLIPHSFLKKHNISVHDVMAESLDRSLTDLEYKLGLKVNHLPTVDYFATRKPRKKWLNAWYFSPQVWYSTFVTRREYGLNNSVIKAPFWSFVMEGHGIRHSLLVGMPIDRFKDFLRFLHDDVKTKICIYSTCYGAGVNLVHLCNNDKEVQDVYSYPLISQALTDAIVLDRPLSVSLCKNNLLRLRSFKNFKGLFNKITDMDFADYKTLTFYHPLKFFKLMQQPGMFNMPQIKYLNLPWFSILYDDKVIKIDSVLAHTRTQPLSLLRFFAKKDKKPLGLLLYTDIVPFELVVDGSYMPAVVSMLPGSAVHHMAKISSKKEYAENILDAFLTLYKLDARKLFIIHELEACFNTMLQEMVHVPCGTLKNVIIECTKDEQHIFFSFADQLYRINVLWDELSLTRTLSIVQVTADDQKHIDTLLLSQVASLDTAYDVLTDIQNKAPAEPIVKTLTHIMDMIPDNNFLYLASLTCTNSTSLIDVLRIIDEYVTLKQSVYFWIDQIVRVDGSAICNNCIICSDKIHGTVVLYTQKAQDSESISFFRKMKHAFVKMEDYSPYFQQLLQGFLQDGSKSLALKHKNRAFTPGSFKSAVASVVPKLL